MRRGFTMLELLVAIGLMVVVMSAVFANYPEFNRLLSLDGIANKVALTIREAQQDSVSGKEFRPGTGCYPGYGIRFGSPPATSYILFGDIPGLPGASTCPPTDSPGDGIYNGVAERIQTIALKQGYSITALCKDACSGAGDNITSLTILFPKRQTGAAIMSNLGGPHSSARITVSKTGSTVTKRIYVGVSGHAYVQ